MNKQDEAQVLKNLDAIDGILQKAQITRGGNSERREWSGSTWEDQSIPSSTPNGTDYDPAKPIAHKAIGDCTGEEIREYLESLAKGEVPSSLPNPIAAEQEILKTLRSDRVAKARCPICDGTMISKSNPGMACERCKGYGYIWMVKGQEEYDIVKAIERKWNLNKSGPQGKNTGGGRGAADTTAPNTKRMRTETLDTTGEDVSGGETEMENPNASKSVSPANPSVRQEMADMDKYMAKANGDEEMEEVEEAGKDTSEPSVEKCAKKSFSDEISFRSFQTINRSQAAIMDQIEEFGKALSQVISRQEELFQLNAAMAKSNADAIRMNMAPGTRDNVQISKSMDPRVVPMPARGPKSVARDVQVIEKAFADQAPGGQAGTLSTLGKSRYETWQLAKGASDMVMKGLMNDHHLVTRLDAGSIPDEEVLLQIEKHIDENPSVLPKTRQAAR